MKLSQLTRSSNRIKLSQIAPAGLDDRGNPNIEPSESLLQRAMRVGSKAILKAFIPSQFDSRNPVGSSIESVTGFENSPGAAYLQSAERARGSLIEDAVGGPGVGSTILNIATDPLTYLGGGGIAKPTLKTVSRESSKLVGPIRRGLFGKPALELSNRIENIIERKGASASKRFGQAIERVQATRPDAKVSFLDDITKPQMDLKVSKLINKTDNLKLYDLDNLTLKDSQQVINDLKANLRQSLKTGDIVKSDEREILRFIGELKSKQRFVFPEIDEINKTYGTMRETVDELSSSIPGIMEGSGNRIQRASKVQQSRSISPKIEEILGRERRVRNVAKAVPVAGGFIEVLRRLLNK